MLCPLYLICHLGQLCSICGGFVIVLAYFHQISEENEAPCLHDTQAASFPHKIRQKYACTVTVCNSMQRQWQWEEDFYS